MYVWMAVIIRKVKKGAVVRDTDGTQEVLVPWAIKALTEINQPDDSISSDPDAAWAENQEEKNQVKVGGYLALATDANKFPASDVEIRYANFADAVDRITPFGKAPRYVPHTLIIFHDFSDHRSRGDSGSSFATAVNRYYEQELGFPAHRLHTKSTYASMCAKLKALRNKYHVILDRILIVTHGSSGQLWLGSADDPKIENTVGMPTEIKKFVSPTVFGNRLKELFGSGLSISIFSCDLAHEEGIHVVTSLAAAAEARSVYAATNTVFLNASKDNRSTATCEGGYVVAVYPGSKVVNIGNQIPVFTG